MCALLKGIITVNAQGSSVFSDIPRTMVFINNNKLRMYEYKVRALEEFPYFLNKARKCKVVCRLILFVFSYLKCTYVCMCCILFTKIEENYLSYLVHFHTWHHSAQVDAVNEFWKLLSAWKRVLTARQRQLLVRQ